MPDQTAQDILTLLTEATAHADEVVRSHSQANAETDALIARAERECAALQQAHAEFAEMRDAEIRKGIAKAKAIVAAARAEEQRLAPLLEKEAAISLRSEQQRQRQDPQAFVELSVGGKHFECSMQTLQRCSVFARLLEAAPPNSERLCIDGDPTHFQLVINHLRWPERLPVVDSLPQLKWLLRESQFYCLDELTAQCQLLRAVLESGAASSASSPCTVHAQLALPTSVEIGPKVKKASDEAFGSLLLEHVLPSCVEGALHPFPRLPLLSPPPAPRSCLTPGLRAPTPPTPDRRKQRTCCG